LEDGQRETASKLGFASTEIQETSQSDDMRETSASKPRWAGHPLSNRHDGSHDACSPEDQTPELTMLAASRLPVAQYNGMMLRLRSSMLRRSESLQRAATRRRWSYDLLRVQYPYCASAGLCYH
jgi:hypothetical protein